MALHHQSDSLNSISRKKKRRHQKGPPLLPSLRGAAHHTTQSIRAMEEMMMVMMKMKIRRSHTPNNNNSNIPQHSPNWKLYENPFYASRRQPPPEGSAKQVHRLQLPVSARKIAASFWDLAFINHHPGMEADHELEKARGRIEELKAEVAVERGGRRKSEGMNKRLAKEVSEERRGREVLERVCEELVKEVSSCRAEIGRMRKEMEEERKMLRTAQIIREERVQMKLAEAKILLEEKLSQLETCRSRLPFVEKKPLTTEAENPHIRRGIKGFVEFPKVVRAIGCRSSKHLGSKLECQKAQLKILLKQKGPVRLITS